MLVLDSSNRKGALAAALGIALYTLLVGAGASVVRAALMSELASWFLKEREWQLLAGKLFG